MAKSRFGQLPPRYTFALNPYQDTRFSKCPKCNRATYSRMFPLLIHINESSPLVLGKTCRYCSKCELIIAHQDELEGALTAMFAEHAPDMIGNAYFVLGTVEKKAWRKHMDQGGTLDEICPHTADIKKHVDIKYEPAQYLQPMPSLAVGWGELANPSVFGHPHAAWVGVPSSPQPSLALRYPFKY